jgi:hypothetical protein
MKDLLLGWSGLAGSFTKTKISFNQSKTSKYDLARFHWQPDNYLINIYLPVSKK